MEVIMSISQTIPEFWLQRVNAWQQSGLSQKVWCDQHGVSPSQFSYWKRKQQAVPVNPDSEPAPSPFVPAVVEDTVFSAHQTSSSITVTFPNGVTVSGIDHQNLSLLKELMEVLQ